MGDRRQGDLRWESAERLATSSPRASGAKTALYKSTRAAAVCPETRGHASQQRQPHICRGGARLGVKDMKPRGCDCCWRYRDDDDDDDDDASRHFAGQRRCAARCGDNCCCSPAIELRCPRTLGAFVCPTVDCQRVRDVTCT